MKTIEIKQTRAGAFMVADLLEKGGLAPVINYRSPFWNPPVPGALREVLESVHVPTMNWNRYREVPAGTAMVDIDKNAAWLSAASSVAFAHGLLEQTGPHDPGKDTIRPGAYLVDVHHWAFDAPGHPLGSVPIETPRVWVTHATYKMLRDLTYGASWTEGGHWPDATAYDSWTSVSTCRLTDWTNAIRDARKRFIATGDRDGYDALKLGYSQAVEMWNTAPDPKGTPAADRKKKNLAYRPDWYATVRSQHAFDMWRRAYQASVAGHPPVAVGGAGHAIDGMAFTTEDLGAVLAMPKSPIRLDETGSDLGTFKRTSRYNFGEDE